MILKFKLSIIIFIITFFSHTYVKAVPASFADLAEKLMPSVVNISTTQTITTNSNSFPFQFPPGSPFEDMFKDFGVPQERKTSALGSGFIISKDGLVITNNHVIKGAEDIYIRVNDDEEYKAKIVGTDPLSDLAVLQIESEKSFKTVKFGDSDKARIGDWVIAIGNPFGLGGTVTAGIISARNRSIGLARYEDFIQTDASINQGNSGGPLFNMEGDVIGINTAILGQSGSIGIGFAIPSNSAKRVIEQLIEFGETKRGWLGVRIQVVSNEIANEKKLDKARGALVVSVADGSPSDDAGIKAGDIILEFNGVNIKQMQELPKIVAETDVGKLVDVKIWRNQKEIIKQIELGRLETSEDFKTNDEIQKTEYNVKNLNINVRQIEQQDLESRGLPKNTKGLVITYISKDSPINYLSVGNIILEAQNRVVKTIGDLEISIKTALRSSDKTLLLVVYNNQNQKRSIGVKLD